jgi:hypothetical protein
MAVSERIDLARSVGRGTLLQLRLDPDPRVLASVLENRFTTEPDVIQAAARTREPAILELIARHSRWIARSGIRSAVLRNPALPRPVALGLLSRASLEDLRGIRDSPGSSPLLRACAERVLADRRARMKDHLFSREQDHG